MSSLIIKGMDLCSKVNRERISLKCPLEMFCEFCYKDGKSGQPVDGFCVECVTYFCTTCLKYHEKFHPDHTQQNIDSMPQDFYTQMCTQHTDELVKFFCLTCNCTACFVCKTNSHIHCSEIHHLPKLAKDFNEVKELQQIKDTVKEAEKKVEDIEMMIESGLEKVKRNNAETKAEIIQDRKEINEIFDIIVGQVDEAEEIDGKELEKANNNVSAIQKKIEALKSIIKDTEAERQKSKVFVATKKAKVNSLSILRNLQTFKTQLGDTEICKYVYKPFDKAQNKVSNGRLLATKMRVKKDCNPVWSLAVLIVSIVGVIIRLEKPFKAHELKLTFEPQTVNYISKDRLLVKVDSKDALYTVDKTKEKLENHHQSISLHNYASSTLVKDELFIMFKNGYIQKYTINEDTINAYRKKNKSVRLHQSGQHFIYNNGTFFILYGGTESHIDIYDENGYLLKNILFKDKLRVLGPWNIAVSLGNYFIYITDSDSVTMLTWDGEIKGQFRHKDLIRPRGMSTDTEGNLYVCGYLSKNVFKISPDLSHGYEIFGERHGINHPFSITYNPEDGEIAVGSFGTKSIHIFKLNNTWFQYMKSFLNSLLLLF